KGRRACVCGLQGRHRVSAAPDRRGSVASVGGPREALQAVLARPRHVVLACGVAGLVAGPRAGAVVLAGIVVLLAAGHAVRRVGLGVAAAIALLAGAVVAEARLAAAERPAAAPLIGRSASGRGVGWGARRRAQAAVAAGLPQKQAALARGMVLGQDDALDDATREEFRASGLSHLLAASGQNVVLLALLATTGLGLLGAGLRARLAGALV